MKQPVKMPPLLNATEAAEYLQLSPKTLANWRSKNEGPRFLRVGRRRILYRAEDLIAFSKAGASDGNRKR